MIKVEQEVVDWLLEGEPWVQYQTRLLLGEHPESVHVRTARQSMLGHPKVKALVDELAAWPGSILNSHKSAGHPIHKLTFLADLGLTIEDPGMGEVAGRILEHPSAQGPLQVLMNVPKHFGGSGEDVWTWALCDAPFLLFAMVKMGLKDDPKIGKGIEHLTGLVRPNGWPCTCAPELGKFRGPGRKEDPCPFANLAMLKLLGQVNEYQDSPACHAGVETQLRLWEMRQLQHPYMFYAGTDFLKLKAPLVWYDILHVVTVLSHFPWCRQDDRYKEMADELVKKADSRGLYTPESIWTAWKDWDFGQKKEPSRWLTYLVLEATPCNNLFPER